MRVLILSCVCLCACVLAPQSNFAQQIPATDDGNDNYRRVIPGDNVFHLPEEGSMIVIVACYQLDFSILKLSGSLIGIIKSTPIGKFESVFI